VDRKNAATAGLKREDDAGFSLVFSKDVGKGALSTVEEERFR